MAVILSREDGEGSPAQVRRRSLALGACPERGSSEARRSRRGARDDRRRQVTIIDEGAWAETQLELGVDVDPSARRANVMLRGIDLEESRGKTLRLGDAAKWSEDGV